jgi:adenylate cyclase class 2
MRQRCNSDCAIWARRRNRRKPQRDCYLAHPCRDFAATDEALRIRTIGEESVLTYKGPAAEAAVKIRREIELPLDGKPDRWLELFAKLEFRPVLTVSKVRKPFRLEWEGRTFQVMIDDVPPLGLFAEIELLAEPEEVSDAQAAVRQLARVLGLDAAEEKTYLELMGEAAAAETNFKKSCR